MNNNTFSNCYFDVTNKIFAEYTGRFSFFSIETTTAEIIINTGYFKWTQPNYFGNDNAAVGVILHEYRGTHMALNNTEFIVDVVYSGKFGLVCAVPWN